MIAEYIPMQLLTPDSHLYPSQQPCGFCLVLWKYITSKVKFRSCLDITDRCWVLHLSTICSLSLCSQYKYTINMFSLFTILVLILNRGGGAWISLLNFLYEEKSIDLKEIIKHLIIRSFLVIVVFYKSNRIRLIFMNPLSLILWQ